MCRMSAFAATALAALLTVQAAPAEAGWFGKKDKTAEAAKAKPGPDAQGPAPVAPLRATPEERSAVERMDPLARAAFWAREFDRNPTDAEAGVSLARALRAMGRNDEAASTAQQITTLAPANLEGQLELARAHIARGQGFYAVAPAQAAQALAPRDWRPVSLLAIAYEQVQRTDEALAAHRKALALAPGDPGAMTNLAMFLAASGQTAEAEQLLRKAAGLPGADMRVRQNLALVLGLQGRFDEAERLARQDLPPELVANNMAYLRAVASTGVPTGANRSWDAMRAQ